MVTSPPSIFGIDSPYRRLARSLDALPNGFPPAEDESDLRLLQKIFSSEEADLAANLLPEFESPHQIADRLGRDPRETSSLLRDMVKKGLIATGKTSEGRLGFGLLPFVVGIYELQIDRIDAEMAQLFEAYYQKAFTDSLKLQPPVHRVVPVGESVNTNMEIHPFESVTSLVDNCLSWGVLDCLCRTQKSLIGDPCHHPIDVCMVLSQRENAFENSTTIRPLTRDEAIQTLQRAAEAGLVHCISNYQNEIFYICNCCTCSCGVLRGMAEMGIANVVAHSAFVNQVDEERCTGCGECLPICQFKALKLENVAIVQKTRCVGCGVCVLACPQNALGLVRRLVESVPPVTEEDWRIARRANRKASESIH